MAHAHRGADTYAVRISIIQLQVMCSLNLVYVKKTDIYSDIYLIYILLVL